MRPASVWKCFVVVRRAFYWRRTSRCGLVPITAAYKHQIEMMWSEQPETLRVPSNTLSVLTLALWLSSANSSLNSAQSCVIGIEIWLTFSCGCFRCLAEHSQWSFLYRLINRQDRKTPQSHIKVVLTSQQEQFIKAALKSYLSICMLSLCLASYENYEDIFRRL